MTVRCDAADAIDLRAPYCMRMGDCMDMDDDAFLDAFECGALQSHGFRQRDHLRMAWLYISRYGLDQAASRAEAGLRNLAALHGHPERYSATRTSSKVSYDTAAAARLWQASAGLADMTATA